MTIDTFNLSLNFDEVMSFQMYWVKSIKCLEHASNSSLTISYGKKSFKVFVPGLRYCGHR